MASLALRLQLVTSEVGMGKLDNVELKKEKRNGESLLGRGGGGYGDSKSFMLGWRYKL